MISSLRPRDFIAIKDRPYIFIGVKGRHVVLVDVESKTTQSLIKNIQIENSPKAIKKILSPFGINMLKWPKSLLMAFILAEIEFISQKSTALYTIGKTVADSLGKHGPKSSKFLDAWEMWRKELGLRGYGRSGVIKSRRIVKSIKKRNFLSSKKLTSAVLPPPKKGKILEAGSDVPYSWYPKIPEQLLTGQQPNLVEAHVFSGTIVRGLSYVRWFQETYPYGKAQNSDRLSLYHFWFNRGQGSLEHLTIQGRRGVFSKSRGPGYYRDKSFLAFPFPEGYSWKLPYWPVATLSTKEIVFEKEIHAVTGCLNKNGEQFRYWFNKISNLPACPLHQFSASCKMCAEKAYNKWSSGA